MNLSESDLKRQIQDYLNVKGYFWWRNNVGAFKTEQGGFIRVGAVGSPDIFLLHKGILVGLEIKSKKGHQTEHQKAFEQKMQKNGGLYFIIRSFEDILQVEKIVK